MTDTPKKTSAQRAYEEDESLDLRKATHRNRLWVQRIRRARSILQINDREAVARDSWSFLIGNSPRKDDICYLNEGLPILRDAIESPLQEIPPVEVESRQEMQEDLADAVGSLIDESMGSGVANVKPRLIDMEWDEALWGIGIGKRVWRTERLFDRYRPTDDEEFLRPHVEQAQYENLSPDRADVAETDDHGVHYQVHEAELARMEPGSEEYMLLERHMLAHSSAIGLRTFAHPAIERVDPKLFLYDPDATTWAERRWEAELCYELVQDLEAIPGINKRALKPENAPPVDEFDNRIAVKDYEARASGDYENARVRVWKIHDRVHHSYILIPQDGPESAIPLLETDWPYGSIEIYDILVHMPVPGRVHGLASIPILMPKLEELGRVNSNIRRHNRRAANAKMIAPKGALDHRDHSRLESTDPIAEVSPQAVALMKEFSPPTLPQELIQYRDMLLSEIRRFVGADVLSQGGETPHQITASEAQIRAGFIESRRNRRQDDLSAFLENTAAAFVLMYRDFADEALLVRTMGSDGVSIRRLDPSAIPEDLHVTLDLFAADSDTRTLKYQQAQQFVSSLTSLVPPERLNTPELIRFLGTRGDVRNPNRFLLDDQEMMAAMPTGQVQQQSTLPSGQPDLRFVDTQTA